MSNIIPKPKPPVAPPPPPATPTPAQTIDPTTTSQSKPGSYSSMVSTTPQGLTRKASTAKATLIGGA